MSALPRQRVAVVGPGRAGTGLALALVRAGHRVITVAGGRDASRERFRATIAGVRAFAAPAEAVVDAELVLLCVPDDALESVVTELAAAEAIREGQRVVHVAGSRGLDVLRRAALSGARIAACHPAQTFPSTPDPDALLGAAWAVTAPAAERGWAHELVVQLGGQPHDVDDDRRVLYHAALVVGSNTVGAAVAVARQLLLGARVDAPEAFLAPLVDASIQNVLRDGAAALTGPVVRGDVGTVRAHLAALDADVPALATAYRGLSRVLLDQVRATLPPDVVARLEDALGG